jgi:hypothetical protein
VRTCLLFVTAAVLNAQSSSATYTTDINGNRVTNGAVVSSDGTTTDLRQSINGREVPLEQVQSKVLSESGNTKVTERIVRHYGTGGEVVQTERVVSEETKTGDGSLVHSTTYRSDISGNMSEAERKTVETRKNGAATVTNTAVEKKDLNGSFSVAEKRSATSEPTSDGKRESEDVYLRDANGNLYEAQRSSTVETKTGTQIVRNTAVYEPTVDNGSLALARQQITKSTTNPDGSSSQEMELFGRASDGRARAADAPPQLTERRTIERQKSAGGAVIETQTVQLPDVNNPGKLEPGHKVSETICRGECDKKN